MRPRHALAALATVAALAGCSSSPPEQPAQPVPSIDVAAWRADLAAAGVTTRQTTAELLAFGRQACATKRLVDGYLMLSGNAAAQEGMYLAVVHTCPDRAAELQAYRTT